MNEYERIKIDNADLENATKKLPVVLLLDNSGSMMLENKMKHLNKAVKALFNDLYNNPRTKRTADICIITFNTEVSEVAGFLSVEHYVENKRAIPKIRATRYATFIGRGLKEALKKAYERKQRYKDDKKGYYQPVICVVTDGLLEGESESDFNKVVDEIKSDKHLCCVPIGVGLNYADQERLDRLAHNLYNGDNRAIQANSGNDITSVFKFVTQTIEYITVEEINDGNISSYIDQDF